MKIAVIGAGFAGMATTYYLTASGHHVDLFDAKGIGEGTSGIAAGLLHPYVGRNAKYNWLGNEGMAATDCLLNLASEALGDDVILSKGLFRPAFTQEQEDDFRLCAENHADVRWVEGPLSGIVIDCALTVDCNAYLKGLWLLCQKQGAQFIQKKVENLQSLCTYDQIIICVGADSGAFGFPIVPFKGQILTLRWPQDIPFLPMSVSTGKYISPDPKRGCCYVGATYERKFANLDPNIAEAAANIMPEILQLFPYLKDQEILACRAGIRAYTRSKKPVIEKLKDNVWIFAGLGSKGLLYHALFAQSLVFEKMGHSKKSSIK